MSLKDYINEKPVIMTERVMLRSLCPDDVPALKEWTSDPSLYLYWGASMGKNDKNPELLFKTAKKPTKSFHFGIFHLTDKKVIGELWVYLIEKDRNAKVAYRINPAYKGKGYATEALGASARFCFENTELMRLWTSVDARNTASLRVLEKCGFSQENYVKQGKMGTSICDFYTYALEKHNA